MVLITIGTNLRYGFFTPLSYILSKFNNNNNNKLLKWTIIYKILDNILKWDLLIDFIFYFFETRIY